MGNFWTGAKNIQNELGHLVVQEREEAIKKKKKPMMSEKQRIQLKELLIAKVGTYI